MHVYVVIPVHNHVEQTLDCLASLMAQTYTEHTCIVVDGGSTDGTPERVAERYPAAVVLRGDDSLWWTGATAMGIRHARARAGPGDFVLMLNNDTQVGPDYLEQLVEVSEALGRAVTGSLNVDRDDPSRVVDAGVWWDWRRVRSSQAPMQPESLWTTAVNTLSGRGMLVPVEVFDRIGSVDAKNLPHYAADYEFAMRAARAGFTLAVAYRAVVRVDTAITGCEGDLATRVGWEEAAHLLFSRRSIRNVWDRLRFVRLACPARYKPRNYAAVLAASTWLLTNVTPLYEIKNFLLSRFLSSGLKQWMIERKLLVDMPRDSSRAVVKARFPTLPSNPLVSVIIPCCNRRAQLETCLASLFAQTYQPFEILVVDDCSIDDTPALLRRLAEENPPERFRWFRNDVNSGANHSRNRGVNESHGEILAFIDSDCVARRDWIEQIVRPFTDSTVAAVVGRIDDPAPRNLFELTHRGGNRISGESDPGRLVGCNMAVRRKAMQDVGWDEDRRFQAMVGLGVPDTQTSGGCDEEGIYLVLRAMGYRQRTVPEAVVLHNHFYTGRSFFRQAYIGGGSAAHLVYKYRLPTRLDVLPFLCTYLSLLLLPRQPHLWGVPLFFFAGACTALIYNELVRKGKTLGQMLRTFPILLAYYHVRVLGYIIEAFRVRLRKIKPRRVDLRLIRQCSETR